MDKNDFNLWFQKTKVYLLFLIYYPYYKILTKYGGKNVQSLHFLIYWANVISLKSIIVHSVTFLSTPSHKRDGVDRDGVDRKRICYLLNRLVIHTFGTFFSWTIKKLYAYNMAKKWLFGINRNTQKWRDGVDIYFCTIQ